MASHGEREGKHKGRAPGDFGNGGRGVTLRFLGRLRVGRTKEEGRGLDFLAEGRGGVCLSSLLFFFHLIKMRDVA